MEFMLENFFENEKHAGGRNIAIKLLTGGHCIVAGDSCIWNGGVGNFIYTSDVENAVGCLLYNFDLEAFLKSDWFEVKLSNRLEVLNKRREVIEATVSQLLDLQI